MTPSLIILIPLVLLGLVTALCFIGCGYPQFQFDTPFEAAIVTTPNVLALWPLNDAPPQPPATQPSATDLVETPGPFPGQYTTAPSVPYDNVNFSAAAPGTFALQQGGIVPGDIPSKSTTRSACASFDGGFVNIPFAQALFPQTQFTVEAWVKPSWTADDAANFPATRGVVVSADGTGVGWAITATRANLWAANIGVGTGFFALPATTLPIVTGNVVYLAMTFNAGTGKVMLYVGDVNSKMLTPVPGNLDPGDVFAPNTSMSALPLYIGKGRSDLTHGLYPFNGSIQDVAIYGTELSKTEINGHFNTGIGS